MVAVKRGKVEAKWRPARAGLYPVGFAFHDHDRFQGLQVGLGLWSLWVGKVPTKKEPGC